MTDGTVVLALAPRELEMLREYEHELYLLAREFDYNGATVLHAVIDKVLSGRLGP